MSRPEFAERKSEPILLVNNRYIRHPYFHKAVLVAFENLISANEKPSYFIYFHVEPDSIDVNIHPTKTEVKFENEQALWQILMVTVKESLGKYNAVPSIDFDTDDAPNIPIFDPSRTPSMPKVNLNPDYNPRRHPPGVAPHLLNWIGNNCIKVLSRAMRKIRLYKKVPRTMGLLLDGRFSAIARSGYLSRTLPV